MCLNGIFININIVFYGCGIDVNMICNDIGVINGLCLLLVDMEGYNSV